MVELDPTAAALPRLEILPPVVRVGAGLTVTFEALRIPGATRVPRYEVGVFDLRRERLATLLDEPVRPSGGLVTVEWDGRDDRGHPLPPGSYRLRVEGVGTWLRLERSLFVRG